MLKQWLDVGRCLMGLHQGAWVRPSAEACLLVQTCELCGEEARRVEHTWSGWQRAPESPCTAERVCERCGEHDPEARTTHQWGPWTYVEGARQPGRWCERCADGTTYLGETLARTDRTADPQPGATPEGGESATEGTDPALTMLSMIRAEYEAQVARGQIAASRRPRYAAMLDELERLLSTPAPDLVALQARSRRVQEMLAGFSSALMDPSRAEPAVAPEAGSRAAFLRGRVEALHAYVLSEIGDSQLTGETGAALGHVLSTLHHCRDALAQPMDDTAIAHLERDSLRPLASAIRDLSLREHLGVAMPIWPSGPVTRRDDAVCFSGSESVGALVAHACAARGLRVLRPTPHHEPGTLRWRQMQEAALAVFDFTRYERTDDVGRAAEVAPVAYEFGIALALGRPVVVIADPNRGLPFDLDVTPVVLDDQAEAGALAVGEAIDATLYGLQRSAAGSSVAQTLAWLRTQLTAHDDMRIRTSLHVLDEHDVATDAVKARLVVSTLTGYLGATGPVLVTPDGASVFYQGTVYDKKPDAVGPKTFVDKVAIRTAEKTRIFESDNNGVYERVTSILDPGAATFIIARESPTEIPQFYRLQDGRRTQLTHNEDPTPDLTRSKIERFVVSRPDGMSFRVTVNLPHDYVKGTRLPALFWFYPREYATQEAYDRGFQTFNKNSAPGFGLRSMEYFVRLGYAVVEPDAPIFGPQGAMNNNYVHDLRTNLSVIIDELDRRALVDRTRLALGGHSYGAFSTVNAMVHTPFFKAGIAGDGAYNRTLTPLGFQSERRDLWEAPQVYLGMSPFLYANNLTGALLMYHGLHDQNVGTDVTNSIRLFHALNGLGKQTALYLYPLEDHGPASKETLLDLWARWAAWLDKYVKNAGPNAARDTTDSQGGR